MGENNSKTQSYQTKEIEHSQGVKSQQCPRRKKLQETHLKTEQLQEARYLKTEQLQQQAHLKTEQLQQEISVKAYLFSDENKSSNWDEAIETRRFLLTVKDLSSYTHFRSILAAKFPMLAEVPCNSYQTFWRDNERDNIIISSDEELAHAMRFAGKDGLKIYIKLNHSTFLKPSVVNNTTEQLKGKSGWQEEASATNPAHLNTNTSKKEQPVRYKVSMKDLIESISALSVDKKDASAADCKLKYSKENSQELLSDEKLLELKKLIKKKIEEKKLDSPFEDQLRDRDNSQAIHHHRSQANAGTQADNFPPPQHHFHQQGFKRGKSRGRGRFQHRGGHHQAQRQKIYHQDQMRPEKQEENVHEPNNANRESRQVSFHHPLQRQSSQEQMQPVELKKQREIKEKKPGFQFEDQLRDYDNPVHHIGLQANEGTRTGNFAPQHHLCKNPPSQKIFWNRGGDY